jgi:broad specificity phosphatase PhoE
MLCVYVRHGITSFSLENRFAGRLDLPILSVDEEQMGETYKLIELVKPTILVHSPLLRAIQTAQYFKKKYTFNKIIEEPLLIERSFGALEGQLKSKENRIRLELEPTAETLKDFDKRVNDFCSKYTNLHQVILVVGHSAFYRQLLKNNLLEHKKNLECCESRLMTFE